MTAIRRTGWRWAAVVAALLPLTAVGCGGDTSWPDRPGPKVAVSFPPIYCFAQNVAGDDAVVKTVMTTTGPHDFNPTDTEARLLTKADLFLINGLGLDTAIAEKLKTGVGNRKLKLVELAGRLPKDQLLGAQHDHEHGHDHGHSHQHESGADPHIWLSPENAILMVEGIRDELKELDPAHADGYTKRAAEYVGKLRKLKTDGVELLKDKKDRRIVTFHESLAYFARDFGLEIEGVVQKKAGTEPNSDELKELVKVCQKEKVRLIAVEPQYTSKSAEAVLTELRRSGIADPATVEIDPLETADPAGLTADWYERKLRADLEALAKAMK